MLDRNRDVLPIPYFHAVFTVPAELNPIIWRNQRLSLALLFRSVSETLLAAAANPRLLGARIGFICVLHTWGRKLSAHPHIHCLITGGGLDGDRWVPAREDYLLPVRVLSRLFRGKFLSGLGVLHSENKLHAPNGPGGDFRRLVSPLYRKEWVVYCKEPFKRPEALIGYLGRYTHRVAITNSRLLDFDGKQVTLSWRDYENGNRNRSMVLERDEFIRRFLLHVLPAGFVKIRYYGLLANRVRADRMAACRSALSCLCESAPPEELDWKALLKQITGLDVDRCVSCGSGTMILIHKIEPLARPP